MSRFIFPYGIRFQEDGKLDIFPAAEMVILGDNGKGIRAMFHLDSGATTSILPLSDAKILGIKAELGDKMAVRGISGEVIDGYKHIVIATFQTIKIKIPIIFVSSAVPRILGREAVFQKFAIVFDEIKRRTAFLETRRERKIINSIFN